MVLIYTNDGEQLTPLFKLQGHPWKVFSMDGVYYCAADTKFTVINENNETAVFNISGELITDFGENIEEPKEE